MASFPVWYPRPLSFFLSYHVFKTLSYFAYLFLLYKIVSVSSISYVHPGTGIPNTGTATTLFDINIFFSLISLFNLNSSLFNLYFSNLSSSTTYSQLPANMATVLLILDVQNGVIDRLENTEPYLERLALTVTSARKANVKIIHVVTAFRPGYPENSANNSSVPSVVARGEYLEGHSSVQVHPTIAPASGEVVLTKRRVSAFFATELDMLLRCANTDSIVVTGLITSGAVLSTVRQAMDMDYRVTVLEDCCMDRDEELHRMLMDKVFARKTDVVSAKEWAEKLSNVHEH